jgi:hypothetical protein
LQVGLVVPVEGLSPHMGNVPIAKTASSLGFVPAGAPVRWTCPSYGLRAAGQTGTVPVFSE